MIFILIIGIACFLLGAITLMSTLDYLQAVGFCLGLIGLVILITIGVEQYKRIQPPITDLPEESISNNPNRPDTLIGYYQNDTLHISFTGKHR